MSPRADGNNDRVLASNRAATHEYHLLQRIEAGIVLRGTEVKSVREGKVVLKDAYARFEKGEATLHHLHISPYSHGRVESHDPLRPRRLLLHAREIRKLAKESDTSGMTVVPLRLYLKAGRIKVELALARGKKEYDKREASRRKEVEREMARERGPRRG
jgi:SsrA-binding protein